MKKLIATAILTATAMLTNAAKPEPVYTVETVIVDAIILGDSGVIPINRTKSPREKWIVSSQVRIELLIPYWEARVENTSPSPADVETTISVACTVGGQSLGPISAQATISLSAYDGVTDGLGLSGGVAGVMQSLGFTVTQDLGGRAGIPFSMPAVITSTGEIVSTRADRHVKVTLIDTYRKP